MARQSGASLESWLRSWLDGPAEVQEFKGSRGLGFKGSRGLGFKGFGGVGLRGFRGLGLRGFGL